MKTFKTYVKPVLVLLLVLTVACKSDDPVAQTAQEEAFAKLAGSWDLGEGGSIIVDGQDVTANFDGFSLSFTDGGYNTTNAGDLFQATGTWTWADENARQINLDDGKEVTIVTLTEQLFVFSFTFAGTGGEANHGEGTAGTYTITVNP